LGHFKVVYPRTITRNCWPETTLDGDAAARTIYGADYVNPLSLSRIHASRDAEPGIEKNWNRKVLYQQLNARIQSDVSEF